MINNKSEREAKQKLKSFLEDIENILDELVNKRESFFKKEYCDRIYKAWNEIADDFHFEKLKAHCVLISSDKLQDHGLYGEQLKFKISVFNDYKNEFSRGNPWYNFRVRDKLFKIMNDILSSIVNAIGFGGAIKEFKDFLENTMDYNKNKID